MFKTKHKRISDTLTDFILESQYHSHFFGYFSQYITFKENDKIQTYKPKITRGGMIVTYNPLFIDSLKDEELRFLLIYICFQFISKHDVNKVFDKTSYVKALSSSIVISNILQNNYTDKIANNPEMILRFPSEMREYETYLKNAPHTLKINESVEEYIDENFKTTISYEDFVNDLIEYHRISPQRRKEIEDKLKSLPEMSDDDEDDDMMLLPNGDIDDDKDKQITEFLEEYSDELEIISKFQQNTMEFMKEQARFKEWLNEDEFFNNPENSEEYNIVLKALADMDGLPEMGENSLETDGSQEEVDQLIDGVLSNLKNRGVVSSDMEKTLEGLRETRVDYMRIIKSKTNNIISRSKRKTYQKPNRREISALKGKKKQGYGINCILDTSGSMWGQFDLVLSTLFQNGLFINLIQIDTEVKDCGAISSKKQLESVMIQGGGGTIIQPGIDYLVENSKFSTFNTVILTDGWTDTLDTTGLRQVLIISCGDECDLVYDGNVTQIKINPDELF